MEERSARNHVQVLCPQPARRPWSDQPNHHSQQLGNDLYRSAGGHPIRRLITVFLVFDIPNNRGPHHD